MFGWKKAFDEVMKKWRETLNLNEKIIAHNEKIIKHNEALIAETFPESLAVKIKYFVQDLEPVVFKGDWCDLRAAEDVDLKAGEYRLIRLGVGMILPEGYEARIAPRSSTFDNFGVIQTNSVGIIDNKYCGDGDEWRFPAVALRDTHISKGDRICQFRLVRNQPPLAFEVVEKLGEIDRGGLGSTGTR